MTSNGQLKIMKNETPEDCEQRVTASVATAPHCPLCGSPPVKVEPYLNPKKEFEHIFGGRHIAVCETCNFGHTFAPISDEQLGIYYASSFDPRYFKRVEGGDWPFFDERSISQILLGRYFTDFKLGDGFLDVGPGVGISFYSATCLLDDPRLFGVEMNLATIALMRKNLPNVSIVQTLAMIAEVAKETPIKMCITSHCLEHFNGEGVISAVRDIYDLLAPGGTIVAEVPHWDLRRWNYRRNDVPHLSFFSQRALELAIERGGFEVVYSNVFGIPHKAARNFETKRRLAHDLKDIRKDIRRDGADFLLIVNSADFQPRPDGKILRVVGRKSGG